MLTKYNQEFKAHLVGIYGRYKLTVFKNNDVVFSYCSKYKPLFAITDKGMLYFFDLESNISADTGHLYIESTDSGTESLTTRINLYEQANVDKDKLKDYINKVQKALFNNDKELIEYPVLRTINNVDPSIKQQRVWLYLPSSVMIDNAVHGILID